MKDKMKDKMTPLQRAKAKANGEAVDRLPCNPNLSNGIARISGCKISDFNKDPRALADAVIATYRRFGADGAKVFTDLFLLSEAMGAKMKMPDDDTVDLLEPAINDISEIDKIPLIDPYKDARLPIHLKAMEYVHEELKDEVPCTALIVGPFTNACFIIGVEKMTKLMIKDPESVHKLCEISLENCIRFTDAAIKTGVGISIAEPMASCTVISPKHFREYCAPYLSKYVDFVKSKLNGVSIHICGQTKAIWTDIADMGINAFSIDDIADMEDCVNTIGDRMVVTGNVDPSAVMYAGTKEEVRKAVIKSVQQGYKAKKGYGIMSGCGLPVETPIENIDVMMDTAREIGWPVTDEKLEYLLSINKYEE
nr:putative methyltransferase [Methanococcus voltae PS]